MSDPIPTKAPAAPGAARTIRRIVRETAFVAILAAMAAGIAWEFGEPTIGLIIAAIICLAGTPLLEVIRLLQARHELLDKV